MNGRRDVTANASPDGQGQLLKKLSLLTMYEIGSSGFCLTVRLMTSSIFLLSSANARQLFRSL